MNENLSTYQDLIPPKHYYFKPHGSKALAGICFFIFLQLFAGSPVWGQTAKTVTGKVTDERGEALTGVSVMIKGTGTGVATNNAGIYSLQTAGDNETLVFKFIGYTAQEVQTSGRSQISVQLKPDSNALNEVVVIGYGTQQKKDLTGSVSVVTSKSFENLPVTGFDAALQGQAAGVQVTQPSGVPGAGLSVKVRGTTSINAGNDPLYVIDGVPYYPHYYTQIADGGNQPINPLNAISPADIESMTVLKDASSTAIYGARAANGVVIITTKKGKAGSPKVDFNFYTGTQKVWRKLPLLNSTEFADLINEESSNSGGGQIIDPATIKYNTNWQDEIFRSGPQSNYQLAVSGGTDKSSYYISGNYLTQKGTILNTDFNRYAFKVNADNQVFKAFKIGTSINLSHSGTNRINTDHRIQDAGVLLGALSFLPTVPAKYPDGTYSVNPYVDRDNPVAKLETTTNEAVNNQLNGNVYGELKIIEGLTFRPSLSATYFDQKEDLFILPTSPGFGVSQRGFGTTVATKELTWISENTLNYDKIFDGMHHINALLGYTIQDQRYETIGLSKSNFVSGSSPTLNNGSVANPNQAYTYAEPSGIESYLSRLNYTYADKYLFSFTFRADGSSRFGPDNRFGYFPAGAIAWRVKQEDFLKESTLFSDLKLRASYGASGNQEIPNFAFLTLLSSGGNYPAADGTSLNPGLVRNGLGNDKLKWEKTAQLDLGIDVGVFNNRLTVTADVYDKKTTDLLFAVPLPQASGYSFQYQNLGKVQNKGLDLSISSVNFDSEKFGWNTSFNISFNRNKVIDIGTLPDATGAQQPRLILTGAFGANYIKAGQPIGVFYGYVADGIFQNQTEINNSPKQAPNPSPGDIKYKDVNNDGFVNDDDRAIIGNPNPKFTYGINNTFRAYGFDLNIFLQGVYGNDLFNANKIDIEGMDGYYNQTTAVLNRWKADGDHTDVPRAVLADPANNRRVSTRFIEDGSFLRIKNLTIGYGLPKNLISHLKLSRARVYLGAQNLATFTKYKGYDPEVNSNGLNSVALGTDLGTYPQPRTFLVGLNLGF